MSKLYTGFCRRFNYILNDTYGWLANRENLLFVVLICVHLLPIWLFKYFPSQDGAAHIYSSKIFKDYYSPEGSLFREYYIINRELVPNLFSHFVLAGLMNIVPPLVAEKLLLSSYVILLPTSVRYALRAIHPNTTFLTFLAFPFIYNRMLHMGFYNFSYGLPIFFIIFGYWLKHQKKFTIRSTITLCFLSLVLYFCHLVSLFTAFIAIATLTVWLTLFESINQSSQQRSKHKLWKKFSQRALMPLLAFSPTFILLILFTLHKGSVEAQQNVNQQGSLWSQILRLLTISPISSYNRWELLFSTMLGFLLVGLFFYFLLFKVFQRQFDSWDGLLVLIFIYIAIYFITPSSMFGGGKLVSVNMRLIFFPFFILILWLGRQSYPSLMRRRIQVIAIAIALILLGLNSIKYAMLNDYLKEYISVESLIEPKTTILTYQTSKTDSPEAQATPDKKVSTWRINPFFNASDYIATDKQLINFAHYQAALDYFPILFQPTLKLHKNPYFQEKIVEVIDYFQETGKKIDYILLWGRWEKNSETQETKTIRQHLRQKYELIYTSSPRGLMQLYRRQDWK